MRRLTRWLALAAVQAYPPAWRERYGEELAALLEELDIRPGDLRDLVGSALRERVRGRAERRLTTTGGPTMDDRRAIWLSRALAIGALLVALPYLAFVTTNLLRYQFGLVLDESNRWWYENSQVGPVLFGPLGGPLLAIGLAALAMARFGWARDADGALLLTARFQPSRVAIVAGALGALLVLVIVGYGISENAIEAIRR